MIINNQTNIKKNMKLVIIILVAIFIVMMLYFAYSVSIYGQRWFTSPYNQRLQGMKANVIAGTIFDTQNKKLAYTNSQGERVYLTNDTTRLALSHVVGDSFGMTQGAELMFAKYLFGFDSDLATSIGEIFSQSKREGSDVVLTVDVELSKAIYQAMGKNNGSVVLMNYKTGEILASISKPGYDPLKADEIAKDESSTALFNRATMGKYPPGSTFKIITATAILNAGMEKETHNCTGSIDIGNGSISCAGGKAHGEVSLESAFNVSCNTYFAKMSEKLGAGTLKKTAEAYGYNQEFLFSDVILYTSVFEKGTTALDTALSGIGQYHNAITPLHAAMIAGAIANKGNMMAPKMLKEVISPAGKTTYAMKATNYKNVISEQTAEKLYDMMVNGVKSGTGSAASIKGVTVGGKTGTAQYTEKGELKEHAWFVGFMGEEHPLCIAVVLEGAGSGGKNAAPIAKKAFSLAIDMGY